MTTKRYFFNPLRAVTLFLLVLVINSIHLMAQTKSDTLIIVRPKANDSLNVASPDISLTADTMMNIEVKGYRSHYERHVQRYKDHWQRLIPRYMKVQYAGGIGVCAVGLGWDYGKNKQWETDILFGYLPKFSTKESKLTITVKQNYLPWHIKLGKEAKYIPLNCGIYMNSVASDDFWVHEPERYPQGYYGFSSKIRFHIFAGQRFTLNIKEGKLKYWKDLSFFYEFSTCDLYLISAFTDKYLKASDIISLSLGIKLQIL